MSLQFAWFAGLDAISPILCSRPRWPQYNLPTFKIIMSTCLQKVQTGEEISLVRLVVIL